MKVARGEAAIGRRVFHAAIDVEVLADGVIDINAEAVWAANGQRAIG